MPFDDDPRRDLAATVPRVLVGASALAELTWIVMFLGMHKEVPAGSPLAAYYLDGGSLERRVRSSFGGHHEGADLILLGDVAGVLLGEDLSPLLDDLQGAAERALGMLEESFTVETPEARGTAVAQIHRLAADPAFRDRYRETLEEAWEVFRPSWEMSGRQEVQAQVELLQSRLVAGDSLYEILPPEHIVNRSRFADVIARALRSGRVVLTPLFAASGGAGGHLFDLPDTIVLGVPVSPTDPRKARRRRADHVAKSLKVLSDGTRVALLASVASHPASVTDLAEEFELAQPTVSVHIQKLRAAGLLEARRENGRTIYSATASRVDQLLGEARDLLMDCYLP